MISPNAKKIEHINNYFEGFDFKVFDENSLENKLNNKKECIRLLSKLASNSEYKQKVLPLTDLLLLAKFNFPFLKFSFSLSY